tara:strand:+ start:3659 stop:4639 length:981 start_codon:yes stop_codon:yes gene_type:complete
MAEPSNIGALGGIGKSDMETISQGLANEKSQIGSINAFGQTYGVSPIDVVNFGIGMVAPPIGYAMNIGKAIGQNNYNTALNNALGLDPTNNSMQNARTSRDVNQYADVNKDGKITGKELNQFGLNYANKKNVDPTGLGVTSGAVGSSGNLGGATGVGYTSGFFGGLGFGDSGESTGIDTSTSAATAGQDTATSGPTGTSYADDAQSSDTGGGGGTYICTALYEMGDMKKSIYKYDQIYGKQVDPATYRGYELWGKYVASKLRKKGIVYKIAKPIALTWANQMAYDLSKGKIGKNSTLIKITKTIGEGACYVLGQIFKRRKLWLKST